MSSGRNERAWFFVILIFFGLEVRLTAAYEVETHARISRAALADQPDQSVNTLLINALGLAGGRGTLIKGKLVEDWVAEGAQREDELGRYVFHFHNPLPAWDGAGLFGVSPSSAMWAQSFANWWRLDKVRLARTNALAHPTRAGRDNAFADLFRGLGQLIHLIQDAASPAHTRNDPHYGPNYETLVRALHTRSLAADPPLFQSLLNDPVRPDAGWRTLQPNTPASPSNTVAKLIDSELYQPEVSQQGNISHFNGTNPQISIDGRAGLAEYSNANFLSEDSGWAHPRRPFRYPARPTTIVASDICGEYPGFCFPDQVVPRLYYQKQPPGDSGYRLATVGFLRNYFVRWNLDPERAEQMPALDETVYRDYARRLVKRAVGYSAAFLEDFLRGEFSVQVEDSTYWITNRTDRLMEGRFEFYYERPDGTLVYWWVNTFGLVALPPGEAVGHIRYALAPGTAVTCRYVFRGRFDGEPPLVPGSDPFTWPVRSAHAVTCPLQEG